MRGVIWATNPKIICALHESSVGMVKKLEINQLMVYQTVILTPNGLPLVLRCWDVSGVRSWGQQPQQRGPRGCFNSKWTGRNSRILCTVLVFRVLSLLVLSCSHLHSERGVEHPGHHVMGVNDCETYWGGAARQFWKWMATGVCSLPLSSVVLFPVWQRLPFFWPFFLNHSFSLFETWTLLHSNEWTSI